MFPINLDQICLPNPRTYRNELEKTLKLKRNKCSLATIAFSIIINFFFYCFTSEEIQIDYLISVKILLGMMLIYMLLCRSHENVLDIILKIIGFVGPFQSIILNQRRSVTTVGFIFGGPLGHLVFSNDLPFFLVNMLYQASLVGLFLREKFLKDLDVLGPESFVNWVVVLLILILAIISFMVSMIYTLQPMRTKIIKDYEYKKEESEKIQNFVLSFSGELRNILNSILGSIELALLESKTPISDYLNKAKICSEILMRELMNILDSNKELVGELEIQKKSVHTVQFINWIWSLCGELIKSKNLKGYLIIDPNFPKRIIIDQNRVSQIVVNLISNSVKFNSNGKVLLKIVWKDQRTSIQDSDFETSFVGSDENVLDREMNFMLTNSSHLVFEVDKFVGDSTGSRRPLSGAGVLNISVIDNGNGISVEDKAMVFKKGFKKNSTGCQNSKFSLSLFISKKLAQLMNGDLCFFSQENQGSWFCLGLPALAENFAGSLSSLRESPNTSFLAPEAREKNIMIVDDDDFNVKIIDGYLNKMGHKMNRMAKDGQEAVDKYVESIKNNKPIELITMDINMPRMNGKKAAEEIRRFEKENSLTPCAILMISGNYTQSEVDECLKTEGMIRANGFLSKPVKFSIFENVMKNVTRK